MTDNQIRRMARQLRAGADGYAMLRKALQAARAPLLKRIKELEEMNRNILAEYKKQIEELEFSQEMIAQEQEDARNVRESREDKETR